MSQTFQAARKFGAKFATIPTALMLAAGAAHADVPTEVGTAVAAAKTDLLAAIGMVIAAMVAVWGLRKLGQKMGWL